MYKKRILLTNFSRGMVSSRFSGRVDTNLAQAAVEEIEGFVVHPDGGLVRRRGTIYGKDGIGISPGGGIPGFITFQKRNTTDGYEVTYLAWVRDNSGTFELVIKNMETGVENVIAHSKLENAVGTELFTSGKINNVYVLKSDSSLALQESTSSLSEKTGTYNPTDYANVYSLPSDFYLDYYLDSGENYQIFETKDTKYLATDDAAPTLNYADVNKDTQSAALTGATAPFPTTYTYAYALPADWKHIYYIDTESTAHEIDEEVDAIYSDTANPVLHYTTLEDVYGFDYVYQLPADFYRADSIEPDQEYMVYAPDTTKYLYTNVKPSALTLHYHATTATVFNEYVHLWAPDVSFLVDLSDFSLHGGGEKTDQEISTLFQNRLIAFDRDFGKLWMSAPYAYLDFTGEGHLELEPDFYGLEKPRWIRSRGAVYVGTDQGEYEITSSLPYFASQAGGLILRKISSIGSDQAEYFGPTMILAKDRRLIQIAYQGENQYQSNSIAELIDNKTIRALETVDFGSHRYLCMVDNEGTLWVMTSAQTTSVSAWTKLMTNVEWIDRIGQDLYAAVNRSGSYYVEIVPFDNIQHPGGRDENLTTYFWDVNRYGDKGGFIYAWHDLSGDDVMQDTLPPSANVEVYELPGNSYIGTWTTDSNGLLTKNAATILSDTGHTGDKVYLYAFQQGVFPAAKILTLPLYIPTQIGLELEQPRSINKVILKVLNSMAAKVRVNSENGAGTWEEWASAAEFSGTVELPVDSGWGDEMQVEIHAVDEKPLHILAIEAEVSVGE